MTPKPPNDSFLWRRRIEIDEKHQRRVWPLLTLWAIAVGFACWSAWYHFIPFLIQLTK